ncbi:putative MFS phosphate transporter [Aaosphaeria arxii CBS 175.79]|uniref:Putative MFS phosphate transporter n=1 Tax=Aaosphaeria arxii CBS 175.79 TaxID=1450172 RepID=A0A6A5XIZ5_9PLEO|nr:putative MFS phosphate transporter [Aaosphaeria arxii CBS 175.79]KAF2013238.1 putative MFS phosphate transporter [Aaosphaeria arxii CBS 175.79]
MDEDSIRDYGAAAPHGPNMPGHHAHPMDIRHDMSANEASVFHSILHPDDIYDENGTYWADLPVGKRLKFVTSVDAQEAKDEAKSIWVMFKNDPLSPVGYYLKNMVVPGAGLLLEGYVLFSIGNIRPLLQAAFPSCWKTHETCDETWTQAIDYLEIVGIIVGQILVGVIGDWLGRRWGLIQDAVIMFVGLLMLTAAWGVTQNGWVICYVWSLFFYGIGVGGEYPMTATSGMENAVGSGKVSTKDDRLHRGRKVTSAFLMQGWGQFINQVLLIVLLLIFHHGSGNPPYSKVAAQWTYRISFAVPAVGTLWLVYFRYYKMQSASKQLMISKKQSKVTGYDTKSLKLTLTYFGPRLLATAGAWFANDVFFYGNKLFQNQFIAVLTPNNKSVMVGWLYNLINVGVSLVGYYLASFLIDNKLYGRKWMMIVGFMADFVLFVVPAFAYKFFTSPEHIHAFQAMYFLSSFFNQFGPNSVTFLVAAEVFPTPIRATAHGFSAAVGKLGALLAAVLYNYIDTQMKFYVVPWFGLAGAILTWLFLPDTTGLDLKEQERRWAFIRAGREDEYHGIAIHPKHLSVWERFRGVGKNYDAKLDYEAKIAEMRAEWVAAQESKFSEKTEGFEEAPEGFEPSVHNFFARTHKHSNKNANGANGSGGVLEPKTIPDGEDGSSTSDSHSKTLNEK